MALPLTETTSEKPLSEDSPELKSAVSQKSSSFTAVAGQAAGAASGGSATEDTKSNVEKAADKLYEERIEDEYAKREGGA